MYKPHNNKTTRGKQKTKYSKGSKYFYDNPVITLQLAVNFFLSFSSLQHKFILRQWVNEATLCLNTTSAPLGHFLRLLLDFIHSLPVSKQTTLQPS